jgi:flagellar biosynthesis/type III secretory pathway protein FliH
VRQIEEQSEWPLTSLERLALEEGYTDGYGKGLQQGLQQGRQQGLQEGERLGQIRLTTRVLRSRFGDAALPLEEKLAQVPSLEALEELHFVALEATSLEEFTRALEAALTAAPETAETA